MGKGESSISKHAKGFVLILIILLAWEYFTYFGFISNLVLPRPYNVLRKGYQLLQTGLFYQNVFQTLINWAIAFVVGTAIGLLLGFISGVNKNFEVFILPISAFLRSIPPIALFPIFLILIGPGTYSIIVVGILFVAIYVFPIAGQSAETAKSNFEELSQILNLSKVEFIRTIIIPATLISSIVASRIAASFLFAIIIAGEIIIGGSKGIGAAITEYSGRYMLEDAYFYILFTGLLGLSIDLILSLIQNKNSKKLFN
jgi:ABC-type nitrate/sulfonate/bicarbonate transport system permease component